MSKQAQAIAESLQQSERDRNKSRIAELEKAVYKLEALVASGSGVPIYYLDKIVELEAKLEKAESAEGEDDERNG